MRFTYQSIREGFTDRFKHLEVPSELLDPVALRARKRIERERGREREREKRARKAAAPPPPKGPDQLRVGDTIRFQGSDARDSGEFTVRNMTRNFVYAGRQGRTRLSLHIYNGRFDWRDGAWEIVEGTVEIRRSTGRDYNPWDVARGDFVAGVGTVAHVNTRLGIVSPRVDGGDSVHIGDLVSTASVREYKVRAGDSRVSKSYTEWSIID